MPELLPNVLNACIILFSTAFLCLCPLKACFKASPWRIALEAGAACLVYSLLPLFASWDFFNALIPLLIAAAFFYCCARINLSRARILFVVLGVASVVLFFTTIINSLWGVLQGNIPEDKIALSTESIPTSLQENLVYLGVFAIGGGAVYWLLRHFVIPVVTDPDIVGWNRICLLPIGYSVLGLRVALPARSYPSQKLMFAVILAGVALFTYTLLMQVLKINANTNRKAAQIQSDAQILQIQVAQYEALSLRAEQLRKARHDQHHQYAALTSMATQNDTDAMLRYLKELTDAIPEISYKTYCENIAVNAVINHYAALGESAGENMDIRLDIPSCAGQVSDADLCVVVGNLLENALEACRYVQIDRRFIRALSKVQNGTLSIVVENSYDGFSERQGEQYISRKGSGIGLSSVRAIAEKYNGLMRIDAGELVWKISVLVDMEGRLGGKL